MNKILLNVVSDIHLEKYTFLNTIKKLESFLNHSAERHKQTTNSTRILALCGDIGNLHYKIMKNSNIQYDFFKNISPLYNHILYIPGNHEYYNYDLLFTSMTNKHTHNKIKKDLEENIDQYQRLQNEYQLYKENNQTKTSQKFTFK